MQAKGGRDPQGRNPMTDTNENWRTIAFTGNGQ